MEKKKTISALAYLVFFIPLIADGTDQEYRFHANQGLIVLIFGVLVLVVGTIIPIIGWFVILPIGGIVWLVFMILGIVNAVNGAQKELPLIGKIRVIK